MRQKPQTNETKTSKNNTKTKEMIQKLQKIRQLLCKNINNNFKKQMQPFQKMKQ